MRARHLLRLVRNQPSQQRHSSLVLFHDLSCFSFSANNKNKTNKQKSISHPACFLYSWKSKLTSYETECFRDTRGGFDTDHCFPQRSTSAVQLLISIVVHMETQWRRKAVLPGHLNTPKWQCTHWNDGRGHQQHCSTALPSQPSARVIISCLRRHTKYQYFSIWCALVSLERVGISRNEWWMMKNNLAE